MSTADDEALSRALRWNLERAGHRASLFVPSAGTCPCSLAPWSDTPWGHRAGAWAKTVGAVALGAMFKRLNSLAAPSLRQNSFACNEKIERFTIRC